MSGPAAGALSPPHVVGSSKSQGRVSALAYIEYFRVTGLAGRSADVSRTLDRQVNIFWGLNGSGKTSLLKILHAAMRNDVDALKYVPFESAEVIFWSSQFGAKLRRTLDKESIAADDEDGMQLEPMGEGMWQEVREQKAWDTILLEGQLSKPLVPGRLPSRSSRKDAPYRHSYMPISRLTQISNRPGRIQGTIDDDFLDTDFAHQVRQRWQAYNNEALGRIRAIQQQGLAAILAILFGGGAGAGISAGGAPEVSAEQAYVLVENFLREQRISLRFGKPEFLRRYGNESDLRGVVRTIQEVTADVSEALNPQTEFQKVVESLYSGGKKLSLGTSALGRAGLSVELEGATIPLRSLSSGEKQLLRLMLEVLAAEEDTVMIDEPELSMHVDWQQVLVKSMKTVNPACQLLLATHSPEIMAEINDDFVFEL